MPAEFNLVFTSAVFASDQGNIYFRPSVFIKECVFEFPDIEVSPYCKSYVKIHLVNPSGDIAHFFFCFIKTTFHLIFFALLPCGCSFVILPVLFRVNNVVYMICLSYKNVPIGSGVYAVPESRNFKIATGYEGYWFFFHLLSSFLFCIIVSY